MTTNKQSEGNHYPGEDETYWKNHISSLKASKLTRKEYCQRHNVNYDRFGYWLSRLRHTNELIPVKMKRPEEKLSTLLCTLKLANDKSLQIYDQSILLMILERFE